MTEKPTPDFEDVFPQLMMHGTGRPMSTEVAGNVALAVDEMSMSFKGDADDGNRSHVAMSGR